MPELQAEIADERLTEDVRTYDKLRNRFTRTIRDLLHRDEEARAPEHGPLAEFLDQGLFNAQRLLVLDLERSAFSSQRRESGRGA
jgi:hypothetical protein